MRRKPQVKASRTPSTITGVEIGCAAPHELASGPSGSLRTAATAGPGRTTTPARPRFGRIEVVDQGRYLDPDIVWKRGSGGTRGRSRRSLVPGGGASRRDPQGGEEGWRWKAVRVLRVVRGASFGRNKRMPPGGAGVVSGVWRCRGVPGRRFEGGSERRVGGPVAVNAACRYRSAERSRGARGRGRCWAYEAGVSGISPSEGAIGARPGRGAAAEVVSATPPRMTRVPVRLQTSSVSGLGSSPISPAT